MTWLIAAGIGIFFVGLLLSIALHELGHLSFAKLFKVRTTQYMVGFGPTLWSYRRGETEYGIKWIPFGGYIRMIGMLPPRREDTPGRIRRTSTGPFQGLIESARGAALEEVGPGDHDRVFYRKSWWKKLLIMVAGPGMNFVFAAVILGIVLMGIGVATPQPVVQTVSDCVIPASASRACTDADPAPPAAKAGLKPGDRIVSFNGQPVGSWDQLTGLIRGVDAGRTPIVVRRGDAEVPLVVEMITTQRPATDDPERLEQVGFLGVAPSYVYVRQGPGIVLERTWSGMTGTAAALLRFPEKIVDVWHASFGGAERGLDSPIGIVGASRIGGEIAAAEAPAIDRISTFLLLLASFNLAIGVFNLVPLLPLDGGHIAGALWEGLKRFLARVFRRPDPGHVDVAKALPLAYAMAAVILGLGILLIYADLVNPVRLAG